VGRAGGAAATIAGTADFGGRKSDAGGDARGRRLGAHCGDGDAGRDTASNPDAERIGSGDGGAVRQDQGNRKAKDKGINAESTADTELAEKWAAF